MEAVSSLGAALALVEEVPACIIGGAQIFTEALPLTQRLVITEINRTFECDTFFPEIDRREWTEIAREQHRSDGSEMQNFDYAFVTYQRTDPAP